MAKEVPLSLPSDPVPCIKTFPLLWDARYRVLLCPCLITKLAAVVGEQGVCNWWQLLSASKVSEEA